MPEHRVRGGENLPVCRRYGKDGSIRFLRCRSCGGRFSWRKSTPLFRSHLAKAKAVALLEHVAEGCGVRQTKRLVGVHRDTVTRYTRKAGGHAVEAHDESVALSPRTAEVQFDEKWSFVGKKEANCDRADPADDHRGDSWDHIALDPEDRPIVAVVPGARNGRGDRGPGGRVPPADRGPGDAADDQRRLPGLRVGDPRGLRRDDHAAADGPTGTLQGPV